MYQWLHSLRGAKQILGERPAPRWPHISGAPCILLYLDCRVLELRGGRTAPIISIRSMATRWFVIGDGAGSGWEAVGAGEGGNYPVPLRLRVGCCYDSVDVDTQDQDGDACGSGPGASGAWGRRGWRRRRKRSSLTHSINLLNPPLRPRAATPARSPVGSVYSMHPHLIERPLISPAPARASITRRGDFPIMSGNIYQSLLTPSSPASFWDVVIAATKFE